MEKAIGEKNRYNSCREDILVSLIRKRGRMLVVPGKWK